MQIEIKHRFSSLKILVCGEYESIKECLEKSAALKKNLSGAYLSGADLSGADLSGAYLSGADLSGAYLRGEKLTKEPLMLTGLKYFVIIAVEKIHIGCQVHTANKWKKFKDSTISEMDDGALEWWKTWKPAIMALHKEHAKGEKVSKDKCAK